MSHEVETMAWTGQTPWHGLGFKVEGDLSPAEMLKAAKLDWTVSKRPVFFQPNGHAVPIPDKFVLARDSDDKPLTMVGSTYKPIQNEVAFDFFRQFCEAGKMTMETAGSLWGGRYVWCLARIQKDFKLGKDDEIRPYVCLMSPHVIGKAMIAQMTTVRVVCWNTLSAALGASLKGDKGAFRMPHMSAFDDAAKKRAAEVLGIASEQSDEFQEAATLLSKKKAKWTQVEDYFCEILRYDPKEAAKKKDGEAREPHALPHFRTALATGPGADLKSAEGTWWGALNAVTFVMDHVGIRSRDMGLKNSWVGAKADVKRRALDLAIKAAA